MDLYELLRHGGSVKLEVTGADLLQFATNLIEQTRKLYLGDAVVVPMSANGEEIWLTTEEAAKACKVSKTTLWMWQKAGYLVPSKLGRKKCYAKSEIDKLLHTKIGGTPAK